MCSYWGAQKMSIWFNTNFFLLFKRRDISFYAHLINKIFIKMSLDTLQATCLQMKTVKMCTHLQLSIYCYDIYGGSFFAVWLITKLVFLALNWRRRSVLKAYIVILSAKKYANSFRLSSQSGST